MRIAICDDDLNFTNNFLYNSIQASLKMSGLTASITIYTNGFKLLEEFKKHNPYDIVILDVEMPIINGKELAEKLRVLDTSFKLIFVTSYKQEIYNTIPYHVHSFISKDSEENIYLNEFNRVFAEYSDDNSKYNMFEVIDQNGKKYFIKMLLNDIFYICCINKTVYLHTCQDEFVLHKKNFETIINKYISMDFFVLCRGYAINLHRIKCINVTDVILDNGEKIPVSRRKLKPLLNALSELITREVNC